MQRCVALKIVVANRLEEQHLYSETGAKMQTTNGRFDCISIYDTIFFFLLQNTKN